MSLRIMMAQKSKNNSLQKRVKLLIRSVASIIVLYLCSFVTSIALVALMGYLLWFNNRGGYAEYSNYPLIILFLGSIYLMFSIIGSFLEIHPSVRTDLRAVDNSTNPELFALIEEVATYMKVSPPERVYVTSSASASIVINANIMSIFLPHNKSKSLEIGLGLINTVNYDELRAIIAHEMAHYSQRAMQLGTPVYIIGKSTQQFKASMNEKHSGLSGSYYALNNLFGSMVVRVFERVLNRFKDLSDELEFEADRIAAEYVGSETLISALYKASYTHHNFDILMQSISILASSGRGVENIYAAQRALNYAALNMEWNYLPTTSPIASDRQSRIVKQRVHHLKESNFATLLPPNYNPAREMLLGYEEECRAMSGHIYNELCKFDVTPENILPIPIYTLWIKEMLQERAEQLKQQASDIVNVEIKMKGAMHIAPIIDVKFKILWDGKEVGKGRYRKDFSHRFTTHSGKHKLSLNGYAITKGDFEFDIPKGVTSFTIDLDYKVYYIKSEYHFFLKNKFYS